MKSQKNRSPISLGAVAVLCALIFIVAYALLAQTRLTTTTVSNLTRVVKESPYEAPAAEESDLSAGTEAQILGVEKPDTGAIQKPKSRGQFGVAVAQTLSGLSRPALQAELDDLVSIGIGWIRFDIDWSEIQPYDSEHYNWKNIDRIVTEARSRDIRLVATLTYTPAWARPADCFSSKCAPENPEQFAQFAREAVKRYGGEGIAHWEIWNEPNLVIFWRPTPNVGEYVRLLSLTHRAIKEEDGNAVVISGGLAPIASSNNNIAPIAFVQQMYEEGGGAYFDALGFHPYTFPVPPSYNREWSAWSQMSSTNPSLRSIMVANGDGYKKIWMTEFGAPTKGPGSEAHLQNYTSVQHPSYVSEELQALHLREAFTLVAEYPWAGPLFWYSYKDLGTSAHTIENFFGLLRFDGSKKLSYIALQELFNKE